MNSVLPWAAIAGCYLAIISMYVWVYKQIFEVRRELNLHMNQSKIHTSSDELMRRGECAQIVKRIEESCLAFKESLKEMKEQISGEFQEMKATMAKKD